MNGTTNKGRISLQSFKCKYCGTNYCKACKRGEFHGEMFTPDTCRVCNQVRFECRIIKFYCLKTLLMKSL